MGTEGADSDSTATTTPRESAAFPQPYKRGRSGTRSDVTRSDVTRRGPRKHVAHPRGAAPPPPIQGPKRPTAAAHLRRPQPSRRAPNFPPQRLTSPRPDGAEESPPLPSRLTPPAERKSRAPREARPLPLRACARRSAGLFSPRGPSVAPAVTAERRDREKKVAARGEGCGPASPRRRRPVAGQ